MLTTTILAWIGIATTLLVTIGQWVDPANIKTPWNWGPTLRVTLFTVLTAGVALLSAFTSAPGTPWTQTLMVAGPTFVITLIAHFGHSGAGGAEVKAAVAARRGFTTLGAMVVVIAAFSAILVACQLLGPAEAPARGLAECAIEKGAGATSFLDLVARVVIGCHAAEEAVVDAILSSADPSLAKYKPDAAAAKSDPSKMAALKAHVAGVRAGAR